MTGTPGTRSQTDPAVRSRGCDWRKRMSNHVAYALLTYTTLQIFLTIHALEGSAQTLLPYFALVVAVGAMIPVCRTCDRRWQAIGKDSARDPALARPYLRDCRALWALAIGLPLGLTLLLKGIGVLFG